MEKARELIDKYALGKRVAAAVSGGEDSMALLSVLLDYARAGKLSLFAINVDHCIRKNSASDSAFVESFCRQNNIEFCGKRIDVPALCAVSRRGLECEAHFARKAIFDDIIKSGAADMVATAHHARDNAETMLLHLFRGCGLKGLSGMKVMSENGIFRPFITTQKSEIEDYIKHRKIPYVTDETNADISYDRNYIRHVILPDIESRFPAFEKAASRTVAFAAEADELIARNLNEDAFIESDAVISLKDEFVAPPYIFEALRRVGKTSDVYAAAIDEVMKLKTMKSCARADIGDGFVAAKEYGKISFFKKKAADIETEIAFSLSEKSTVFELDGGREIRVCEKILPYFPTRKGELIFDKAKLPANCVLRHRREGDVFAPFGSGSKKLKEYLIDKKVPFRLRDDLWLLSCDSEVLAIVGMEISDKIKVDANSGEVYCMRICSDKRDGVGDKK